jgi:heme A synthase
MDIPMNVADRRMDRTFSAMDRKEIFMFRYAILLALWLLIAIVFGASLTSEVQPLPGSGVLTVSPSTAVEVSLDESHIVASVVTAILVLGLAIWFQVAARRSSLRRLGWVAVALVAFEGLLGMPGVLLSIPRGAGFLHAMLAQVLLSLAAAIAVEVSTVPGRYPLLEDSGKLPLRSLAPVMPALAFLQVILGAAYRHDLSGAMFHIMNAFLVGLVVLCICMLVIRQHPEHPLLRPAALALAIITGVQIFLGFATFITLLMVSGGSPVLLILSVAHVAIGALTLAGSVVLWMQIRSNLCAPAVMEARQLETPDQTTASGQA